MSAPMHGFLDVAPTTFGPGTFPGVHIIPNGHMWGVYLNGALVRADHNPEAAKSLAYDVSRMVRDLTPDVLEAIAGRIRDGLVGDFDELESLAGIAQEMHGRGHKHYHHNLSQCPDRLNFTASAAKAIAHR